MSSIKIRSAAVEDAKAILDIYSYYVLNTAISFEYEPPTEMEMAQRIRNTLGKYPYIVLEEDNEIKGFAYSGPFKLREAYKYSVENSIYVRNGEQKKGYGKLLLVSLENQLLKMGYENSNACIAFTEKYDEHLNNNSTEFHQHMGYSLVGVFHKCAYKFDKWYDMLWMEKLIGKHQKKQ